VTVVWVRVLGPSRERGGLYLRKWPDGRDKGSDNHPESERKRRLIACGDLGKVTRGADPAIRWASALGARPGEDGIKIGWPRE